MRSPEPPPKPRKTAAGLRSVPPDSLAARLEELERLQERVRGLFDAYFLGLERRAPENERLDLQRRLADARKTPTSNTALKFRLDTLVQRNVVLASYWNRTMREIESGTYRRDVWKAERHLAARVGGNPRPAQPTSTAARPDASDRTLVDEDRTSTGD
jgi:hypothetical protein